MQTLQNEDATLGHEDAFYVFQKVRWDPWPTVVKNFQIQGQG